ncbi:GD18224 [Drosophila simulans]|uniref:GD18224 n=1 Tax=Drosophila simulans TaxID=7240 RepID=B4QUD7_DROSI|nr:GD18224 [Drosophila simulans]
MSGDSDRWLTGTQTLDRPVHQCGGFLCLSLQFTLNSQLSGRTETTFGAILDSRCYLEGGGSAESFLATEDLAVGSIIGKLRINGDANAETGDINLSLREKNAPVEIHPGTKELALSVELDKEGVRGPSSIYVNVICIRRHSTDPVRTLSL